MHNFHPRSTPSHVITLGTAHEEYTKTGSGYLGNFSLWDPIFSQMEGLSAGKSMMHDLFLTPCG